MTTTRLTAAILMAPLLTACATSQTVVPLATDTIQVTVQSHGECDFDDAKRIAGRRVAVETIRRGFDGYVITGSATRTFNPQQEYTARLFKAGANATALDARSVLGPDWSRAVAEFDERGCRG